MQTVEINERAMTCALDYIVGEEARKDVVELYDLLHAAERTGREEGRDVGYRLGRDVAAEAPEIARLDGYQEGYDAGIAAATSDQQPDVDYPPAYEGDSGDETPPYTLEDLIAEEQTTNPYSIGVAPPQQEQARTPWAWSPGPDGCFVSEGPRQDPEVQAKQQEYDAAFKGMIWK